MRNDTIAKPTPARGRRGPPPKTEPERYRRRSIFLRDEDWRAAQTVAQIAGVSAASWIRRLILRALGREEK